MSKNKNNKNSQQAVATEKEKENKNVQTTAQVSNPTKKEDKPKADPKPKKDKEQTATPPPAADPSVIDATKTAEVIDPEPKKKSNIPKKIDLAKISLTTSQRLSGDGFARMLDVAERYISRMKAGEPATIKMEQAFTYNLAWGITKMSIQAREEKVEYGLNVPNDDVIVTDIIDTFNSLGVALAPHVSEDGKQMTLEFQEISPEAEKAAKEEIKQEKTPVVPELDPDKWKSEDDAKKGLSYILAKQDQSFPNRFNETLLKVRTFKKNQETDEEKKAVWDKIGLGALFENAVQLLGNRSTALVRGLCQGCVSALITDHNPIFAHSTVKYNLPMLSEEEAADLIKSFIKVRQEDPKLPIDETPAVKFGILEATREQFLNIPMDNEMPLAEMGLKKDDPKYKQITLAKKIMNKFLEAYGNEIGYDDPKFYLHATNKMIEIRNLYVDKDAAFTLYTESEYPKATSTETADPEKKKEGK